MRYEWIGVVLILILVPLNSYALLPFNHLIGMLASIAWCAATRKTPDEVADAVFWLNFISFFIYLSGFGWWAYKLWM